VTKEEICDGDQPKYGIDYALSLWRRKMGTWGLGTKL